MSRTVESITVTPSPGGLDDRLYVSTVGRDGVRHIEFVRAIYRESDALTTNWHQDDAPGIATLELDSCTTGISDGGFPNRPGIVGSTILSE